MVFSPEFAFFRETVSTECHDGDDFKTMNKRWTRDDDDDDRNKVGMGMMMV
jgi:hypothetical protein